MVMSVLILPIDKKYQYAYVKSACVLKSNYIYHRIYEDTLPIDIAFLGSSHTMCGIDESIVQKILKEEGRQVQVSNMGFCRLGRDMEYLIFKEILQRKKPKMIFLEVRPEEAELGHPDFGYLADMSDILSSPLIINRSFASDLNCAFEIRRKYLSDMLSYKSIGAVYEAPNPTSFQKNIVADTSVLYAGARFRWERYYRHTRPAWADRLMTRYPKKYIAMIMELAKQNNVKVVMLYIPNFGYPYHKPKELNYYLQLADLILMPDTFYDNEKYWMEDEHLNCKVAAVLSDSIAHYINLHLN